MRTQLAHFLRIPPDWNAREGTKGSVLLIGPAGQEIELPARKSDHHPWQWRKDANDAITTHNQPTTTTTP